VEVWGSNPHVPTGKPYTRRETIATALRCMVEVMESSTSTAPLDAPTGGVLWGYVWWCGDEWCDCSQAKIVWRDRPRWRFGDQKPLDVRTVWQGEFHTDGEPGATTELNRIARRLRRHQHDLYARIEWPWNRPAT
jgi:hypothetical protein